MHTVWHSAENKLHQNSELRWLWSRYWIWWRFSTFTCRAMAGLTSCLVYGMGLQPAGIIHNNLTGDAHLLVFFHRLPPNHPTTTGVDLCHKKFGRPWFTETRAIRYQPSLSVHNAPFHSQCHTTHKRSNKTCYNNINLPTNIQYLKIHVRDWIWSQTTQWYINRMIYTLGDKIKPNAVYKVQHQLRSSLTQPHIFYNYIYKIIYVMVKTRVTNIPFTTQLNSSTMLARGFAS
jgi:hypothetical protein